MVRGERPAGPVRRAMGCLIAWVCLWAGKDAVNPQNTPFDADFVVGMLKGKEGTACPTETYSATNKVPKYDYKGLHFKRNYPTACKTGKGKEGKRARLSDDGPPKKKGKQLELSFASPSSK